MASWEMRFSVGKPSLKKDIFRWLVTKTLGRGSPCGALQAAGTMEELDLSDSCLRGGVDSGKGLVGSV